MFLRIQWRKITLAPTVHVCDSFLHLLSCNSKCFLRPQRRRCQSDTESSSQLSVRSMLISVTCSTLFTWGLQLTLTWAGGRVHWCRFPEDEGKTQSYLHAIETWAFDSLLPIWGSPASKKEKILILNHFCSTFSPNTHHLVSIKCFKAVQVHTCLTDT